ncbi:MAG: DUF3667 domain-containing protein [Cytophagales bacterium]|nr:DUF3667 domain-containing protein [Cytophagales bacterium]
MANPKTCKNCNHSFEGNYCNECGQAVIEQFNLRYVWGLLHQDLFEFDRGLWRTIKDLTIKPGHMIREYLNGRTKPYYSSIKYLLFTIAFFYIINSFFDGGAETEISSSNWKDEFIFNSSGEFSMETIQDLLGLLLVLTSQNLSLYFLLLLPFVALVTKVTNKNQTYTEYLITWAFLWGQVIVFNIILTPLYEYLEVLITPLLFVVLVTMIFYFTVTFKQLTGQSWIKSLLKVLITFYGGIFLFFGTALLALILFKLIFVN